MSVPDHIAAIKPYVPGKSLEELERELGITGAIKLASNENPLGPAPAAVEAMQRAAQRAHLYPDGAAFALKRALAARLGTGLEELAVGNGSNELLTLMVRTFCQPGDHAVVPTCSFVAYRVILQAAGIPWTDAPLRPGYQPDVDALLEACEPTTRLLFLANPNNPTGTYLGAEGLRRLLEQTPPEVLVVIDEAYDAYVQAEDYVSALEMRDLRERLIVTRTFSKVYGLGGARCGWAVGPAELIDYVNRVREPFNCNALAQAAATAALGDDDFVRRSVELNEAGRQVLEAGLAELEDREVSWTPSQTNFLLVHLGQRQGTRIYDRMLRQGVIVRPMTGYGLEHSVRITIGTEDQCHRCLGALERALVDQTTDWFDREDLA